MAIKKDIEINVDVDEALSDTEKLANSIDKLSNEIESLGKKGKNALDKTNKGTKSLSKGTKSLSKGFKAVGVAFKAIGIGLVISLVAKLKEVFSKNQKVVDFFSTAMETLTIAFNDLFNFIFDNVGTIVDFFKDIFENPQEKLKEFGRLIKENLIERFNSALEVVGLLGNALKKLFEGDFKGALDSVKAAGVEFVDVLTGVDNAAEKISDGVSELIDKGGEYLKQTIKQAKANVELANTAELATAQQARLVEQYDRLAEKQRQIRDDESISIKERQEANDKLLDVLEQQEQAMIRQADLQVSAAQAAVNTNNNIENQVALTEALANKEGVLAQIEGFRSEQIVNRIALKKEEIELNNSISDAEKERRLAQLDFEAEQEENELLKLEKQRERLEEENQIIIDDLERKRELYAEGTQARIDAEQEYLTKKQEIDNAITANEKSANEEKEKSAELLEESKINLAQSGFSILGQLAKEGSALAKGVAVSQAVISTYQGINKALAETTDPTPTQSLRFANAAAVGIAGFLNVAKILSTKETSTSASGGGGAPSAPAFNLVEGTGTNQVAQSIQEQAPLKAFVVSSDVTSGQEFDRNIKENASL